jgi:hypothetical protein
LISDSNDDCIAQMSGKFLAAAFKLGFLKAAIRDGSRKVVRPSTPLILPSPFDSARATLKRGHPR